MQLDLGSLETLLFAAIDKNPVNLSRADQYEVKRTLAAIKKAVTHEGARFQNLVKRTDFLAACLTATHGKAEEHLIVGYGWRHGNTTLIERIHRVIGFERGVDIPSYIHNEIKRHHRHQTDAEVIVFHNHPRTGEEGSSLYVIKALLDDIPIASREDRQTLGRYAFDAVGIARKFTGGGRVVFFLGESRYAREISLPSILPYLAQYLKTASPRAERENIRR